MIAHEDKDPDWNALTAAIALLYTLLLVYIKMTAISIILQTCYDHYSRNGISVITGASIFFIYNIVRNHNTKLCHMKCYFHSASVTIVCNMGFTFVVYLMSIWI